MPTEAESIARYHRALHAVQTGVLIEMRLPDGGKPTEPKRLRTSVNAAQADQSGLATLLIAKGVFTREEYLAAIADSMEAEQARYEAHLSPALGREVKLG